MRIVALDTETTGLELSEGHRIIEIGCVEIENRRLTGNVFHSLLDPERAVDEAAFAVHGIGNEQLDGEPRFVSVEEAFLDFLRGAEVIVHNAAFDVGFIDMELSKSPSPVNRLESVCKITDTLAMARARHPGQRNSIDSLCKRYDIDLSSREKHGALIDAQLLAQVYLAMTGGQISLVLGEETRVRKPSHSPLSPAAEARPPLSARPPSPEELTAHRALLKKIDKASDPGCLWLQLEEV